MDGFSWDTVLHTVRDREDGKFFTTRTRDIVQDRKVEYREGTEPPSISIPKVPKSRRLASVLSGEFPNTFKEKFSNTFKVEFPNTRIGLFTNIPRTLGEVSSVSCPLHT